MTTSAAPPPVQTDARRPRQNTPARLQPMTRKQPVQKRAEITVKTIIDAAHELHIKLGIDAVTTEHVAEQAGVAIGTIYRYFPNRYAILIKLGEIIMEEEANETLHRLSQAYRNSLEKYFACVFERTLCVERRLLGLGRDFYLNHWRKLSFVQYLVSKHRQRPQKSKHVIDNMKLVLSYHIKDVGETDPELASFMLMGGFRSLLISLIEQSPELLDSPALQPMLTRMAMAIVAGNK